MGDKAIGVKYKGGKMNRFNLLSRAGRREWRAAGRLEAVNANVLKEGVMAVVGVRSLEVCLFVGQCEVFNESDIL